MQIGLVGTGYVGLVAGACFADAGHDVVCVDVDGAKVEALRRGEVPIYEPGLPEVLARSLREGRIAFTTSHAEAVRGARVVFFATGTPEGVGGVPDLSQLERALGDVLPVVDGPLVLVLKSTVPVGTAARVKALAGERSAHPVRVVSNPEFLKEGAAVEDFLRPDRVLVGTDSDEAFDVLCELYQPFLRSGRPVLRMSNEAAELAKYASNAMLATRISFMNEVARLCDALGVDVEEVRRGVGTDARIGPAFLYAGCGYGGSCFPKDVQGLIHVARAAGIDLSIAAAAERVNDLQKGLLVERVKDRFGGDLSGRRFALWGLAFKPRTDDVREAPSIVVARGLVDAGAEVVGTDPEAAATFRERAGVDIAYAADPYEAARGADAVVLCTEWSEYRSPDFDRLGPLMRERVLFDGRNVIDPARAARAGFEVWGIGRGRVPDPSRREADLHPSR